MRLRVVDGGLESLSHDQMMTALELAPNSSSIPTVMSVSIDLMCIRKTPKKISGKVPYRFVTPLAENFQRVRDLKSMLVRATVKLTLCRGRSANDDQHAVFVILLKNDIVEPCCLRLRR
ncbi:hypothetical protein TNCV_4573511 [Trichonephila clavipes]|nr:hypothetical protein TNCV_4573511 [Trichonephila clavipes]